MVILPLSLWALPVENHPLADVTVLVGDMAAGGMGSGVVLTSDGYIATAAHVVHSNKLVVVVPYGDHQTFYRWARVVYLDTLQDIAILKVQIDVPLVPVKIGSYKELTIGATILHMGHPMGIGWLLSIGHVASVKYDQTGRGYIFADIAGGPGSSGGGLYNENNELVGIAQQGIMGLGLIGITIDHLILPITAVILADRELAPIREEMEQLSADAKREWEQLINPKEEDKKE